MRFPFFSPGPPDAPTPSPGPASSGANGRSEGASLRLVDLQPGQRGLVLRIDGEPHIVRRLMEFGLVPGTPVDLIRRAPFGDPFELGVRGTHLSIRRTEASQVHVELL